MLKRIIINISLLIIYLFVFDLQPVNASVNSYKIDVNVDSLQRIVNGTAEITFFNNSKDTLDKIYFLLGLNKSYDTNMKITEVSTTDNVIIPGNTYKYTYLEKETEDKTIYRVSLPSELPPEESIKIKLKFEILNLAKINNILFFDDSISDIFNGSWYPKIINYQNGEWKKRDFVPANYEVNIIIGGDENIAASGIEISNEIIKAKGLRKISYQINDARSFSMAISKYISNETEELKNDEIKNGIIIKSYYKNNKSSKWNKIILETTKEVLSFYYKKFGFFPYRQLSILPGNNYEKGGYTDNNMIIIHETFDSYKTTKEVENNLKWYLSNYIGQLYFGYLVGESGEKPKWLTSGAVLYLTSLYLKDKNIETNYYSDLLDTFLEADKANFNTKILQPVSELENSNFDWEKIIEKGKSAYTFSMLGNIVGKKILTDALREVLIKYKNSFISTSNFESIIELMANKKMDWFFNQWVNENKKLDYGVSRIKQERNGKKYRVIISIKKPGKAIMPVSIVITLKSGIKVFQVWEGNKSETDLTFEYSEPVRIVELDPTQSLPDIDRSNNKINAPAI